MTTYNVYNSNKQSDYIPYLMERLFKDSNVISLFHSYLSQLPPQAYILQSTPTCLFLHLNLHFLRGQQCPPTPSLVFLLRIAPNYPLSPPRLLLTDCCLLPRICDGRDLYEEAVGHPYTTKDRLLQVVQKLHSFSTRLLQLNKMYLRLQGTGTFHLHSQCTVSELGRYSALNLLRNTLDNTLIGVSQTHILTYRRWEDERCSLIQWCHMQCIDRIMVAKDGSLKVQYKRYRLVKSYYEAEIICKRYNFDCVEGFLRSVLKLLPRLQNVVMSLQPMRGKQKEVVGKIAECRKIEENVRKKQNKEELVKLNELYQELIQYYANRANPYYLIFVNCLNKIHLMLKGNNN